MVVYRECDFSRANRLCLFLVVHGQCNYSMSHKFCLFLVVYKQCYYCRAHGLCLFLVVHGQCDYSRAHGLCLFLVVHGQWGLPSPLGHCLLGSVLSAHFFMWRGQEVVDPEGQRGVLPSTQGTAGLDPPGQIRSSLGHRLKRGRGSEPSTQVGALPSVQGGVSGSLSQSALAPLAQSGRVRSSHSFFLGRVFLATDPARSREREREQRRNFMVVVGGDSEGRVVVDCKGRGRSVL